MRSVAVSKGARLATIGGAGFVVASSSTTLVLRHHSTLKSLVPVRLPFHCLNGTHLGEESPRIGNVPMLA